VAVAVLGYASADRCVALSALPAPDTTAIVRRLSRPWPRLGGCGPQIAIRLARLGVPATCLTWVGPDELGEALLAQLRESGASADGVVVAGTRTAESYIVYDEDGRAVCLYDPGDAHRGMSVAGPSSAAAKPSPATTESPPPAAPHSAALTAAQRAAVASASVVCLTVAPAAPTRAALDATRADARVVWSVKADPDAYPDDLVARLLARADVVAWSEAEREFVAGRPREDALVLETRGARGVAWRQGGRSGELAAPPVRVADTTGAGDAFVAGVIAQLERDAGDAPAAVAAGIESSRALLEERGREEART
jgi:sugar/nucleoside kinase (ribokinase family)